VLTQSALFEFKVVNAEFPPIQLALFEFKVVCVLTQLALFEFKVVYAEFPPIQLALFEFKVVVVFEGVLLTTLEITCITSVLPDSILDVTYKVFAVTSFVKFE
jgi:hypothetical protein